MDDKMVGYIYRTITRTYNSSGLEAAQAKYRAYFITSSNYAEFKADVDEALIVDGFEACIVTA